MFFDKLHIRIAEGIAFDNFAVCSIYVFQTLLDHRITPDFYRSIDDLYSLGSKILLHKCFECFIIKFVSQSQRKISFCNIGYDIILSCYSSFLIDSSRDTG